MGISNCVDGRAQIFSTAVFLPSSSGLRQHEEAVQVSSQQRSCWRSVWRLWLSRFPLKSLIDLVICPRASGLLIAHRRHNCCGVQEFIQERCYDQGQSAGGFAGVSGIAKRRHRGLVLGCLGMWSAFLKTFEDGLTNDAIGPGISTTVDRQRSSSATTSIFAEWTRLFKGRQADCEAHV